MSNNEIICAVSGDVMAMISNMAVKDDHRDDLFQEIMMILLEYDNKKLEAIFNKKQLKFFVSRIICNQYYSVHSYFYKVYKKYEEGKYQITDFMKRDERRYSEEEAD